MKNAVFTLGGMIVIGLILFLIWRFASRRHELPCPFWLRWLVELDNPFTKSNQADVIIQHANIRSGMHVIDFGCGPGRLSIPLAERVGTDGKVTAIDRQSGMLNRVRQKAQEKKLQNIEYIQGKIGEGKLQLSKGERAFLVTVLGEIPNRYAALGEIYQALKPGGILVVTEVVFDPHFQTRGTILKLAHQVGFREKDFIGNWAAYSMALEKPIQ